MLESIPIPRTSPRRQGAISLNMLIIVSLIALAALVAFLALLTRKSPGVADLTVFCAAGIRYPMEQIARHYGDEYGVTIQVQYGGSNTLLSQIEVGQSGDLYLAADESYVRLAQQKGLAQEVLPLATMRPVIAVRHDSTLNITALSDLLRPGIRIACGNPDAAAIGKTTKMLLEKSQQWDALSQRIDENGVFKPTVNEVANDVKLGSVDAGIVWDTTAAQYPELQAIHVPELEQAEGVANVDHLCFEVRRETTGRAPFREVRGGLRQRAEDLPGRALPGGGRGYLGRRARIDVLCRLRKSAGVGADPKGVPGAGRGHGKYHFEWLRDLDRTNAGDRRQERRPGSPIRTWLATSIISTRSRSGSRKR